MQEESPARPMTEMALDGTSQWFGLQTQRPECPLNRCSVRDMSYGVTWRGRGTTSSKQLAAVVCAKPLQSMATACSSLQLPLHMLQTLDLHLPHVHYTILIAKNKPRCKTHSWGRLEGGEVDDLLPLWGACEHVTDISPASSLSSSPLLISRCRYSCIGNAPRLRADASVQLTADPNAGIRIILVVHPHFQSRHLDLKLLLTYLKL
ncbi:hypothetical protein K402DRAFT_91616 [Aulographum hederae CBS 113979]|uniref:Uncharacterized protein n=1 Tax=Aulographum hederae CBS 113979 TaxID=1176131 RepID=A0A6G1GYZ8_9PEZI|nr:hypothetical protein K402DRAFT_91616 [Aulographum hederae CBS 113979]